MALRSGAPRRRHTQLNHRLEGPHPWFVQSFGIPTATLLLTWLLVGSRWRPTIGALGSWSASRHRRLGPGSRDESLGTGLNRPDYRAIKKTPARRAPRKKTSRNRFVPSKLPENQREPTIARSTRTMNAPSPRCSLASPRASRSARSPGMGLPDYRSSRRSTVVKVWDPHFCGSWTQWSATSPHRVPVLRRKAQTCSGACVIDLRSSGRT